MATIPQKHRKERALDRLQEQLKSGKKTKKGTFDEKIPLTDKDVQRIEKQIQTLKNRL